MSSVAAQGLRRARFRRAGKCYICGRPPVTDKKSCQRCLDRQNIRTRRLRKKCATKVLCMYCQRKLTSKTFFSCKPCRAKRKVYGATIPNRFSRSRSQKLKAGQIWTLTLAQYTKLVTMPCSYCLLSNATEQACGLDRLNNAATFLEML